MKSLIKTKLRQAAVNPSLREAARSKEKEEIREEVQNIQEISLVYLHNVVPELKNFTEDDSLVIGEASVHYNRQWDFHLIFEHVGAGNDHGDGDSMIFHYELRSRTDETVHQIADLIWGVYDPLSLVHKGRDVDNNWVEGKPLSLEEVKAFKSDIIKLLMPSWAKQPPSNEV